VKPAGRGAREGGMQDLAAPINDPKRAVCRSGKKEDDIDILKKSKYAGAREERIDS